MRSVAQGLPATERALAEDYAAFIDGVHPRALSWPKTDRSRLVASHGLARLGKSNPAAAEAQLPRYAQALGFTVTVFLGVKLATKGRVSLEDFERAVTAIPEVDMVVGKSSAFSGTERKGTLGTEIRLRVNGEERTSGYRSVSG